MTRRLRVALLGQYPEDAGCIVGGVEAVVGTLAHALARRPEIDLHVLRATTRCAAERVEERDGLTLHWLPRRRFGRLTFHVRDVAELNACLDRVAPDVVHAHGTGLYAGAALHGPWPAVITVHGIVFREARVAQDLKDRFGWEMDGLYERRVLRRARHLVAISPYVEQEFRACTPARMHLIENPVPDAYFESPARGEPARVLFAGRVIPRKDPLTAIRAFAQVKAQHPGAELRIAGEIGADPAYAGQARSLVRELHVGDSVHFLGQLDENAILEEYRRCRLVLLSSVQETAPVVIAQALAAGRPVVTTAVGGTPAMVADGETGFVVPAGDAAGLARGMARLLGDDDLYAAMSAAGRQVAARRWRLASVIDQTLALYAALAAEGRRR